MKVYTILTILSIAAATILTACEEYLDAKPDQSLAIPSKLQDLQALLDLELWMVNAAPAAGDLAADYYYLESEDWANLRDRRRDAYLWDPKTDLYDDWKTGYTAIFYSNVVLDHVDEAQSGNFSESARMDIKGQAYFCRGWSFYHLAQIYAPVYYRERAEELPGIALRLTPDINVKSHRATLEATFNRILTDLKTAAALLPATTTIPTRPSKAAAFATIARTYLVMGDFKLAGNYADSSLQVNGQLIDYNKIDTNAAYPFEIFSEEVVLHRRVASGIPSPDEAKVDTALYALYAENDLRRSVFFARNKDSSYYFKGSYNGDLYSTSLFGGITTSEVYLIRAECAVRQGDIEQALNDLNLLRKHRFKAGKYAPLVSDDPEQVLEIVLRERRLELAFRGGIAWPDLRRLNKDPRFARTLTRVINGEVFELLPGDNRYVFLIPQEVIQETGMLQNQR